MINTTIKYALHSILMFCLFSYGHTFASAYDTNASVLRFQTKMAERGVAESQYKLGFMYETGSGVEQHLSTALHWYNQASLQGYKAASNRIVYLQIKSTGMKQQHNNWLSTLKSNAKSGDKDALFLLGQMYAEGTGVNKSLTHSLELLRQAARKNMPDTEPHIIRIERELAALQEKYTQTEITKNIKAPSPVLPLPTSKVASTKRPASAVQKNIKKVSTATKPKTKHQPKLVNKNPPKLKNTKKLIHRTKPKQQPVQNNVNDKSVTQIAATTPVSEAEYRHPMDMICGGSNRLHSGCR